MKKICYYLCCCCCCGRQRIEGKKAMERRKQRTRKEMEAIIPKKTRELPRVSNPLNIDTTEIIDDYVIPSADYKTEQEVLEFFGYRKGQWIGKGGFAVVYEGIHLKTDIRVAIKQIQIPDPINKKTAKDMKNVWEDAKNEIYLLHKTRHPHVIRLIVHFMITENSRQTLYFVLQLAKGGDLSELSKDHGPFPENDCKRWFAQILSALVYMHGQSIAHRDLKLANILLDEYNDVLVSDFGLSRIVYRESAQKVIVSNTYCGTPPYMAPEVLRMDFKDKPSVGYNACVADIWSFGVILFRLITLEFPFSTKKPKAFRNMNRKKYRFPKHLTVQPSPQLQDIISKMFEPEPTKRVTLEDLTQHEWIRDTYRKVKIKVDKEMKKYKNEN